jgi:hypothetical protein
VASVRCNGSSRAGAEVEPEAGDGAGRTESPRVEAPQDEHETVAPDARDAAGAGGGTDAAGPGVRSAGPNETEQAVSAE